jgi:hypothetical protein
MASFAPGLQDYEKATHLINVFDGMAIAVKNVKGKFPGTNYN